MTYTNVSNFNWNDKSGEQNNSQFSDDLPISSFGRLLPVFPGVKAISTGSRIPLHFQIIAIGEDLHCLRKKSVKLIS